MHFISRIILGLFVFAIWPHAARAEFPIYAVFAERAADGSYTLRRPDMQPPAQLPTPADGKEHTLDIVAKRLYVGYLPDILKNDVLLKVGITTDITKAEKLGRDGYLEFTRGFRVKDDMAFGGADARTLLRAIPFAETAYLRIVLFELDGQARKRHDEIRDLLVSIEGTAGTALINMEGGDILVRLAMSIFNLVNAELKKSDEIMANEFTLDVDPGAGLPPLVPGEWIFVVENTKRAKYRIDPYADLVYDGRTVSLVDGKADTHKLPTHLVLSIDIKERDVPLKR